LKGKLILLASSVLILSTLIPVACSDIEITLPENTESIEPIAIGNVSMMGGISESPTGVCVSGNGITFTVSSNPWWEFIRGDSPSSLIAWSTDGAVLWANRYSSWTVLLFDVAVDGPNVYVTGRHSSDLFLGKFDLQGYNLWNTTWDWWNNTSGYTTGSTICLLNDGTIIVTGYSSDYSEGREYHFVVAFNDSGQPQWHEMYELTPWIISDSDFFYVLGNRSLQKRDGSGSVIWSTTESLLSRLACVSEQRLYTYDYWGLFPSTSINITARSITTGYEVASTSLTLCNSQGEPYNRTGVDFETTDDGSPMVLMGVQNGGWYLEGLNRSLQLETHANLLDEGWQTALFEIDDNGYIRVAGLHDVLGLTLAVFSSDQLTPATGTASGYDLLLMGATVAGVAVFDAVFILYLKKKHPV
jgi:hypothetical protein